MARRNPPLHLGLTGGIGSGKSTVAGLLATHGAAIIDADAISRATTAAGGAALPAIAAAFGPRLIGTDGALDRAAMRAQWNRPVLWPVLPSTPIRSPGFSFCPTATLILDRCPKYI